MHLSLIAVVCSTDSDTNNFLDSQVLWLSATHSLDKELVPLPSITSSVLELRPDFSPVPGMHWDPTTVCMLKMLE